LENRELGRKRAPRRCLGQHPLAGR
jgi:hypothetical protein